MAIVAFKSRDESTNLAWSSQELLLASPHIERGLFEFGLPIFLDGITK